MWFANKRGEDLSDPINISRIADFIDFSKFDKELAKDCIDILKLELLKLTPPEKSKRLKLRLRDAKRHIKKIMTDMNWPYKMRIAAEAWDILMGQESIFVPSTRNTVRIVNRIIEAFQNNPRAIIHVE